MYSLHRGLSWTLLSFIAVILWITLNSTFACCKTVTVQSPCDKFEVVGRGEWAARPPKDVSLIVGAVNMTFVHHTAGSWRCSDRETCIAQVQDIQNLHMDVNGWSDIGYSFLVGEDGRVYEGRGWTVVGAHTLHYNAVSYGICVIGNYMERAPSQAALDTTQAFINCGVQRGYIVADYEMFGHKDGRCTLCPGDVLYAIIRDWPHYSFRPIPKYCP